jgi:hypothetical protein
MEPYFSQQFDIDPDTLESYGAFDVSVVSDLPLFIDPFLLFHSTKPEYQQLHDDILRYLIFLRDHASGDLDSALIDSWYRFKEVKQNWLGYTHFGNQGAGLGKDFAAALHGALGAIFANFGNITSGSHLEKLDVQRSANRAVIMVAPAVPVKLRSGTGLQVIMRTRTMRCP